MEGTSTPAVAVIASIGAMHCLCLTAAFRVRAARSWRRRDIDDIGEVVELMSVQGQTLYTYEMTEAFLTGA